MVGLTTGTNTLSNIELIGDNSQSSSDAEIKGTGERVGGLVGDFTGAITDASSSLTVRGGIGPFSVSNTGGLVGILQNGSIKNSNSSGFVSASNGADFIGGLVGQLINITTIIRNSWASGNVSGNNGIGGLVGFKDNGTVSNSWASGNVSGNNGIGGLVGLNKRIIGNSWANGKVTGDNRVGGLVGHNGGSGHISNNWTSGVVSSSGSMNIGGLVGSNMSLFIGQVRLGNINGRNYKLYDATGTDVTNSFHLASTADLASLSGAGGGTTTHSDWHTGFDGVDLGTEIDLDTRFCDTNGNGRIDDGTVVGNPNEQRADNSVWVMPSDSTSTEFPTGISDNVPAPTSDTAGNPVNLDTYYAIPAIRCIANTADATNDAEIYRLRKIEIDRQRRKFPQPSN